MDLEVMSCAYSNDWVDRVGQYTEYDFTTRKELTKFDGFDIEQAYEDGANAMKKEMVEWIEKNLSKYLYTLPYSSSVHGDDDFIEELKKEVGL